MSSEQIPNNERKSQATSSYSNNNTSKRIKLKPDKREGSAWEKLEQEQPQPQDFTHLAYQDSSDSVQEEEDEKITIDYMAKDYTSFRNALLDLIPRKIPQWKDKSEADIGIMLIELFSYIADELSYFQDRVANEAFLRTARARSSIQNHLRLIDYRMHNGRSANAFIKVELKKNNKKSAIIPAGFQISTYPERGWRGKEAASMIIFETLQDQLVDIAYNRILVKRINNSYNGSMNPSAELEGRYPKLTKGQYILLSKEEENRLTDGIIITQVVLVKLAEDAKIIDNDSGGDDGNNNNNNNDNNSTLITWEKSSSDEYPKLAYGGNARVFCCANILKASHGRTVRNEVLKQKEQKVSRFSFTVKEAPLTFTSDLDNRFMPMEARSTLKVWVNGELWEETDSLLKWGPLDQKYSISVDEDGYGTIFFGDGRFGFKPEYDSLIEAQYRVGNGSVGNVGKDTLTQFDLPHNALVLKEEGGVGELIENVTNPLPASDGIEMEAMDDAKIAGPKSLKALERAVTLKDYEELVKREFQNEITNAKARFVYTGSWDTIFISVDVKGGQRRRIVDSNNNNLFDRIGNYINRIKMIGYDVKVEDVKHVPIEIAITVYLEKYFDSEIVRERIRSSLSNRDSIAVNGTKGFFHPDNFTFGDPVYASKIYEVLKNTSEVKYGVITTFRRRRNGGDDNNSASSGLTGRNATKSSSVFVSSSSSSSPRSVDISVKLRDEETKRNLELGYIPINENEIITIDDGGSGGRIDDVLLHPENGILILDFARDNESKTDDNVDYDYIESANSNSYSTS